MDSSFFDLGRLDRLAHQDSPIHRLDPRAKLFTTLVFLVCVVSFRKYQVSALLPFFVFPVVLATLGGLPLGYLAKRVLAVAPFAFFVGIFNPLLDRHPLFFLGSVGISGGWVSFASILLRFTLTVGAAFILIATTSFHGVCLALARLGAPRIMANQLLFLYRYLFVLGDEAMRLVRARALRSFDGRGMGMRVYGHMLGHLLLRSLARAQRVHLAMCCRGFDGEIRLLRRLKLGGREAAFTLGWSAAFLALRFYNVPQLLGGLVTGLAR
ncbi:MAG: cobalt ECF transporter T component CbiQ [Deltaproteobacteria bacterium]|nr:cobalt ECF transporter T component CbiQ [Deltaproteobacteria bacterium]